MNVSLDRKSLLAMAGLLLVLPFSFAVLHFSSANYGDADSLFAFCAFVLAFSVLAIHVVKWDISDLTSWWTFVIILQFGLAPIACSLLGVEAIDFSHIRALGYVFMGTVGFWLGAKFADRTRQVRTFIPDDAAASERLLTISIGIFVVGALCKLYMLRAGLFSYTADLQKVEESGSFIQWLMMVAGFSTFAQIILTIEYFRAAPSAKLKYVFASVTLVNLAFAVVSGMKGEILVIPMVMILIIRILKNRLAWRVAGMVLFLFLVLIPLNSYYRDELHAMGSITSFSAGNTALGRATASVDENSSNELVNSALEGAASRLNLLQVIVFLEQDQGLSNLEGDERLWMMPFYPFVPRAIWPSKPVLDKGRRLSLAMGSPDTTSTAITLFGDLFVIGGVPVVFCGMVFVGVAIQTLSRLVGGIYGPKSLFVYCVMFVKFYSPESDIMMFGTLWIQTFMIALTAAYFIYGQQFFSLRPSLLQSNPLLGPLSQRGARPSLAMPNRWSR